MCWLLTFFFPTELKPRSTNIWESKPSDYLSSSYPHWHTWGCVYIIGDAESQSGREAEIECAYKQTHHMLSWYVALHYLSVCTVQTSRWEGPTSQLWGGLLSSIKGGGNDNVSALRLLLSLTTATAKWGHSKGPTPKQKWNVMQTCTCMCCQFAHTILPSFKKQNAKPKLTNIYIYIQI